LKYNTRNILEKQVKQKDLRYLKGWRALESLLRQSETDSCEEYKKERLTFSFACCFVRDLNG